jgi:hypothetical protein
MQAGRRSLNDKKNPCLERRAVNDLALLFCTALSAVRASLNLGPTHPTANGVIAQLHLYLNDIDPAGCALSMAPCLWDP